MIRRHNERYIFQMIYKFIDMILVTFNTVNYYNKCRLFTIFTKNHYFYLTKITIIY